MFEFLANQSDLGIFKLYGGFLLGLWWLWLPVLLFIIFFQAWIYYIQRKYWQTVNWILLEIKPPKDIERSPKNVESIFAGFWGVYGTVATKAEKYIQGKLQNYFSLEIVGLGGQIRFFIRTPIQFRNLVEAKIYAQYPKAEIQEVEDYTQNLPTGIFGKDWDLWGTVLQLTKPDAYPIRSYAEFTDIQSLQPFIDPMGNLMEVLSKLQRGEQAWVQILVRPVHDDWKKEGERLVAKLIGRSAAIKRGLIREEAHGWLEAIRAVFYELISGKLEEISVEKKKEEGLPSLMQFLSPGEKEIVEAIEKNLAKKGFQAKIQWVYLGEKDVFSKANANAIMGFFNQFSTLNLNGFKPHKRYITTAYYLFSEERKALKKRVMLRLCRSRNFWEKGYVFNTEELATLWHFPTIAVEAPMVPRVEARKGGPPPELPVE